MRFAIVLLAFVACAVALPRARGIIEDVENEVTEAIDKAKADLASLGHLADALIANGQTQVASVIAGVKNQIAAQINNKGGAIAVCAQANLAPLTEYKNNFIKNVERCTTGLSTIFSGIQSSVQSELTSLTASVDQLASILQECTTSITDADVCAFTKFTEIKDLIASIVTHATDAVDNTRARINVSVTRIRICANQNIGEAIFTINKFVASVQQCA